MLIFRREMYSEDETENVSMEEDPLLTDPLGPKLAFIFKLNASSLNQDYPTKPCWQIIKGSD